jgi:hypothetical protein
VAAPATPISAATEQQHHENDNEDKLHWNSPPAPTAGFTARQTIQPPVQAFVPGNL